MLLSFRAFILWLHLLTAFVWVGGLCFQLLVLPPTLAYATGLRERIRLDLRAESRFRVVLWPAVGIVLLTGLYNVMNVLYLTALAGGSVPPAFARVLSLKLGFVVLMIVLQAVAQLVVYPQRLAQLREMPLEAHTVPSALARLQRLATVLHIMIIAFAAAAVWCAILLRG